MARPTDYDQQSMCQKAFELCQGGATDFEVAKAFGVSLRSIYNWKSQHPEFADAMRLGKEMPNERVKASLYHRAVGYSYDAVKIVMIDGVPASVPYVEHVPPDTGAIMHWLSNRTDEWRIKQTVDHNIKEVKPTAADELSDDELAAIASQADPGQAPADEGGSGAASAEPEEGTG